MRIVIVVLLCCLTGVASAQSSLRFYGNGVNDIDRVKIRIDDPSTNVAGPPADVGATDFTIELWLRGRASDNTAGAISCGQNINWINGNIVLDRDRYNQGRKYGLSIGAGRLAFGVTDNANVSRTICSSATVLDDGWHHVALQRRRSDGRMWLYVDGKREAESAGPAGDISYPDNGTPGNYCGGPCTGSDPFLVIGAEKHDAGSAYPSFSGWVDELRLSTTLRYSGATYTVPSSPFVADAQTAALYHFDEGQGDVVGDSSGAVGGPSDGVRRFGGSPAGPLWSNASPFSAAVADATVDVGGADGGGGADLRADLAAVDAGVDVARADVDGALRDGAVDAALRDGVGDSPGDSAAADSWRGDSSAGDGAGSGGDDGCALGGRRAPSTSALLLSLILLGVLGARRLRRRVSAICQRMRRSSRRST